MIELLLLWALMKKIGKLVEEKGRKGFWYKVLTVVLWFGGELTGAVVAAGALSGSDNTCAVYMFALGGAAVGAGVAYLIASNVSPKVEVGGGYSVYIPPSLPPSAESIVDVPVQTRPYLLDIHGNAIPVSEVGFLIGRDIHSQLFINEPGVADRHARLVSAQGNWYIQDAGNNNVILVNGQQVRAIQLHSGDRIRIGSNEYEFRIS